MKRVLANGHFVVSDEVLNWMFAQGAIDMAPNGTGYTISEFGMYLLHDALHQAYASAHAYPNQSQCTHMYVPSSPAPLHVPVPAQAPPPLPTPAREPVPVSIPAPMPATNHEPESPISNQYGKEQEHEPKQEDITHGAEPTSSPAPRPTVDRSQLKARLSDFMPKGGA